MHQEIVSIYLTFSLIACVLHQRIFVYLNTHTHQHTNTHTHTHTHTHTRIHTRTHKHKHPCICILMYVHISICMYACMCMNIHREASAARLTALSSCPPLRRASCCLRNAEICAALTPWPLLIAILFSALKSRPGCEAAFGLQKFVYACVCVKRACRRECVCVCACCHDQLPFTKVVKDTSGGACDFHVACATGPIAVVNHL
jgi:hypothetical protein